MSEQPLVSNVHPIHREGTRFDDVVDHQIDLHSYTGNPYDSQAISRTLHSAEKQIQPNPVRIAAMELSNLNAVRESVKRIEERKLLAENEAA